MKDITGREYIYGIAQDKNGAPYLFNIGELVRCKDCKHYGATDCQIQESFYGIKDFDFCSYGERKGGDDE